MNDIQETNHTDIREFDKMAFETAIYNFMTLLNKRGIINIHNLIMEKTSEHYNCIERVFIEMRNEHTIDIDDKQYNIDYYDSFENISNKYKSTFASNKNQSETLVLLTRDYEENNSYTNYKYLCICKIYFLRFIFTSKLNHPIANSTYDYLFNLNLNDEAQIFLESLNNLIDDIYINNGNGNIVTNNIYNTLQHYNANNMTQTNSYDQQINIKSSNGEGAIYNSLIDFKPLIEYISSHLQINNINTYEKNIRPYTNKIIQYESKINTLHSNIIQKNTEIESLHTKAKEDIQNLYNEAKEKADNTYKDITNSKYVKKYEDQSFHFQQLSKKWLATSIFTTSILFFFIILSLYQTIDKTWIGLGFLGIIIALYLLSLEYINKCLKENSTIKKISSSINFYIIIFVTPLLLLGAYYIIPNNLTKVFSFYPLEKNLSNFQFIALITPKILLFTTLITLLGICIKRYTNSLHISEQYMDKSVLISTFQSFHESIISDTNKEKQELEKLQQKLEDLQHDAEHGMEDVQREVAVTFHLEKNHAIKQQKAIEEIINSKKKQEIELLNHTMKVITTPLDTGHKNINETKFLTEKIFELVNKS